MGIDRRVVVVLAAMLSACTATTPTLLSSRQSARLLEVSDTVLVLPLRDGSCFPVYGDHVKCHLTGEHLDAGVVPDGTGAELARILFDKLSLRGVSLVPYEVGTALFNASDSALIDRYEPSLATLLGRQVGADKVIMGVATRYEDRSGGRFSSQGPAAVAFSIALVDVPSGKVTHRFFYNHRQAPLTTDLLTLPLWWRMGAGWWSRKQIAEETMSGAAESLVGGTDSAHWTNMPTGSPVQGFDDWTDRPPAMPGSGNAR